MTTEMLTYESAIESVKNNEQLKQSVFTKKYKYQDETTFEDTLDRMVRNLDIYLKKFNYPEKMLNEINFSTDCVRDGRFIPGGSILFGFGNTGKKNTLSNCYVTPIERDSIDNTNGYGDGIGDSLTKFMRTYSYRGGLGTDITVLRPRNAPVNNAAINSSGAVSFMPLISEVTETIGQFNRRGACLISLDIRHPDAIRFIKSKSFPEEIFGKNHITGKVKDVNGANISVKITNEFMKAVINDEDWEFVFPDIEEDMHLYDSSWDGDYDTWKELGGKLKSYGKMKAREIEQLISTCAHSIGDPGIIFIDNAVNNSPVARIDNRLKPVSTNPCFTKDTLVAVADGREAVTFEKLIEEGKDVPVYCRDDNDDLVIRMMRNIRVTREDVPTIQIYLDDGSIITTTYDHKIYTKHSGYIRADNLETDTEIFTIQDGSVSASLKVIKLVEFLNNDVCNGTVDEFHNYFVGDFSTNVSESTRRFIAVKNCGEQPLAKNSNCLLGALVLFKYVDNPYTPEASFNHSLFFQDVSNAVVVMNVISDFNESRHPLKEQCEMDKYSKRIGIEFTGLGDFFAMMNLKYGSDECLAFLEPILRLKAVTEITTSCHLAKHMSCCEAMTSKRSRKLFLESSYIKNVLFDNKEDEFVKKDIMKYGLRNTAFNTVGPTGSISIMADNCTSGIEPCFAFSYTRKTIFDGGKDHVILHGPLVNHILKTHPEELENPVSVEEIKNKYNYVEAHELDYKTRIKVQSLVQKYTDSAVSSTINLPNNVTVDTIKEIYRLAWQSNLKGITVFRDGCKTGVLAKTIVTKDENDKLNIYEVNKPIELSDHMPSDRIIVRCNGKKIYATVTLDETRTYPLEIFVSPRRDVAIKNGVFDSMLFQEQLSSWTAVCRLVSLLLRTRAPLECIIDQLDKSSFTITDQYSAITRVLSYYLPKTLSALSEDEILEKDLGQVCPDCGKKTYVKEGGCGICKSCSYTTCG